MTTANMILIVLSVVTVIGAMLLTVAAVHKGDDADGNFANQ